MLLFSLYKVASFLLSGENKEKRLSKILFRVLGHGTPLVLLFLILKQLVNKDTQKETCPRSIFLIAFFKRGFILGVVASLLCKQIMQVNPFFILT